ncbi:MAG: ATP-binding protein [Myxococcales bacterium]|nr:ATP-binding protein [Myxococcales bacterium]
MRCPAQLLEHLADIEERQRSRRSLEPRLSRSHLGRFKPIADQDWNWPTKIDRPLVESAVGLHFLGTARSVVLVAPQGLGKSMVAQNIAHQAILFFTEESEVQRRCRVLAAPARAPRQAARR